jgi:hypothetical protein
VAVVLTPLGKAVVGTVKWLIVPLCAALIGYVLIGPNIGKPAPKSTTVESKISENGKKFRDVRGMR